MVTSIGRLDFASWDALWATIIYFKNILLFLKVSSKSVGFRAFGDYWMSSCADVHPFGNLARAPVGVVCMNLLLQNTFWSNLYSHVSYAACFCLLCLNRWELLKTTVTSEISVQWSLTCVTRTWYQRHLITALFLLEKMKDRATSNVLFPHKSPSDLLVAPLWVSITSSTLLSSPVDSFVNGKLWKRRSFTMLSKCLLKWNARGKELICCCEPVTSCHLPDPAVLVQKLLPSCQSAVHVSTLICF